MKKFFIVSRLSENMHETPEGFLVCLGVPIARTGTYQYAEGETPLEVGKDGVIDIDRAEDEVFNEKTMASFEGKPVTIGHPDDFVTKENWSQLAKGITQNVRRGAGEQKSDLIADLLITDRIAIGLVKNGLREVSCGYEAEYTQTGDGKGSQSGIRGNHVALVDEGRAGSEYAIKDHKGVKMDKKTLLEKVKALFGKAQDEAIKLVEDAAPEEPKKEEKAKDADPAAPPATPEAPSLDGMVQKFIKDISSILSTPSQAAPAMAQADADPAAAEGGLEARLKKLEEAVSKLLESKAGDEDMEGEQVVADEDSEEEESETGDEDMEEEESEDASYCGDTAARVEILAPGLESKAKDIKTKALKACYATKEGKKVIEALNGGKAPAFDSKEKVDMLFVAASELMKKTRTEDLANTRKVTDAQLIDGTPEPMTAEKMNELNAKFYSKGAK